MNFENQIIFFFSALGAFNGFLLSLYFAIKAKKLQINSNYYLSLLLLVLSIRIIKSVFFYFSPNLAEVFIHIGLSACFLIGPYLFLYIQSQTKATKKNQWVIHTVPYLVLITIISIKYPFWMESKLWLNYFIRAIYLQWLFYIICSGMVLKPVLVKIFKSSEKLNDQEIWLNSIFFGTTFIFVAYNIGSFTSYIVGALSFSFILYLVILVLIFRKKKNSMFFEEKIRYKNKEISKKVIDEISSNLNIIKDKMLFKNPNVKLSDIAKELNTSPHILSQFLNDNLGKSFSLFINEYRIEEAKKMLISNDNYTIETIGYESGFNSKSTFFSTFKSIVGITPSKYKKKGN